jgi:hypothetical protein
MKKRSGPKPSKAGKKCTLKHLRAFWKRNRDNIVVRLLFFVVNVVAAQIPSCHENKQIIEIRVQMLGREECGKNNNNLNPKQLFPDQKTPGEHA